MTNNATENERREETAKSLPRGSSHQADNPETLSVEKPLHVQVAEALGVQVEPIDDGPQNPPAWFIKGSGQTVPRYDLDWQATGPWIELLRLTVYCDHRDNRRWSAMSCAYFDLEDGYEDIAQANAPLAAVCNLLLQLHKAGKLNL